MSPSARESRAGRSSLQRGRRIAWSHRRQPGPATLRTLLTAPQLEQWLERASEEAGRGGAEQKIAEWLLDNAHQLRRAVRQIARDLPASYYRRLPEAEGDDAAGLPRVYLLARALATATSLQLDLPTVTGFVQGAQQGAPLRIGELWAVPTMLRIVCLEIVCHVAARGLGMAPVCEPELEPLLADFSDAERMGRAVRGLVSISSIPWNDFVERTSAIEAILGADPAGAYRGSDRETRDHYRRTVEELADRSNRAEPDVAREVVALAEAASAVEYSAEAPCSCSRPVPHPPDEECAAAPRSHVGHWLVGDGRTELEQRLAARVPIRERFGRSARRHALALYLTAVASMTAAALALPALLLVLGAATPIELGVGLLLATPGAAALAIGIVQWIAGRLVAPQVLPKLDFQRGIPAPWNTAVVLPSLLTDEDEVDRLLEMAELHHLSNPDPRLVFVLLTDFADAPSQRMPADEDLFERAARGIRRLGERHGHGVFHLAHRERVHSEGEGCWMGWERKRGKIEEWNAYLRGTKPGAFRHVGDEGALAGVRLVLTLDSDTRLPPGAAARLVGTLAHPLNRPRFDPLSSRLCSGYTIVQPRVEIAPEATERSIFARICAGDSTIDTYSRAVSDVYQDLFGTGIYVGKGIYDVDAFARSVAGRVPENALASHDLFEGIHGRAALATDIAVYEDFPPHYLAYVRRLHRWTRGDWQLLPWLAPKVPLRGGGRAANRLGALERWLILDNLRRSTLSPCLLAMLVAGWLVLPVDPLAWTLVAALALVPHGILDLAVEAARRRPPREPGDEAPRWVFPSAEQFRRAFVFLAMLPFESWVAVDAAARAIVRMSITRRHLLQWQTASQISAQFGSSTARATAWREMAVAPAASVLLASAIAALRPEVLPAALPLLLLWFVSPEVAHQLSRPRPRRVDDLSRDQLVFVRRLARRTWLFFETFVGPDGHWLPPDNYQEVPRGIVDRRTSPTNIGMLLLSTASARDLGYIGVRELARRLADTLDNLASLERHRGHLLNWYDTRTRRTLLPAYVSTVDSGNLCAALVAVAGACTEAASSPVLATARWDGLMDTLGWLETALARLVPEPDGGSAIGLARSAATIRRHAAAVRTEPERWSRTLATLCDEECAQLDRLLLDTIESHRELLHLQALREIRVWLDRVHRHLRSMRGDVDELLPWLPMLDAAPFEDDGGPDEPRRGSGEDEATALQRIRELLPPTLALEEIPERTARARRLLVELRERPGRREAGRTRETAEWLVQLDRALVASAAAAQALVQELSAIRTTCEREALTPDFSFLYDGEQDLFWIGYNVTSGIVDPHHYDLLATECRLASYIAIAKGDVPARHWLHLGRPITRVAGRLCLLSWGGTMFEYLMPRLLLRGGDEDLLSRSEMAAIDAQRAFGIQRGVPWGVSESGFAAVDAEHVYQYRAFGVPGLGIKRDLGLDAVVAPYASALALPLQPGVAADNLERLAAMGAMSEYGLHEAVDFTPSRISDAGEFEIVRSYMSHHQGMVLCALNNHLSGFPLVRQFHAHPLMRTIELLLRERTPKDVPLEFPLLGPAEPARKPQPAQRALSPWRPQQAGAFPELHAIGNGRLATVSSDAGGGALRWMGNAVTAWSPDAALDDAGIWLYVRDLDDDTTWSVTRQPLADAAGNIEVVFHPHKIEYHHRQHEIGIHLEVAIAPGDDVEIRRLSIVNGSDRPRRLAIVSYAEIALAVPEQHRQHPAFSRLFVRAAPVDELDALLFERRARGDGDHDVVALHRLVAGSPAVRRTASETSRVRFLGRLGDVRRPLWLRERAHGPGDVTDLDPVAAIEATVVLAVGATEHLAFTTTMGASRQGVIATAQRFSTQAALDWAVSDSAAEAAREAARFDLDPGLLRWYQTLLSLALQPHTPLRGSGALVAANMLSQSGLWRMGISGDVPIVLVTIAHAGEMDFVVRLVQAHAMWNRRGLAVDLVMVHSEPSGYQDQLAHDLQAQLERLGVLAALHRRGGIHLVRADQVQPEDLALLRIAARVQLEGSCGLEEQLRGLHDETPYAPPFVATAAPVARETTAAAREGLLFDNGTGGFADDGRTYVVRPSSGQTTPAPWSNVLANDAFGTLVTESGGGYTWSGNAYDRRLSAWHNDPVGDRPSEVLYLRDEETGEVWSPMRADGEGAVVETRHSPERSRWKRCDHGFVQEVEVFVAPDEPVKVVRLDLTDLEGRPRRVTATYYVEWTLAAQRENASAFVATEYEPSVHALLARNPWNALFAERVAFLVSRGRPHGFTTSRVEFLGRNGSLGRPAALGRWGLSNSARPGCDPCAALQVHLDLGAGGSAATHYALGDGRDRVHAVRLASRWRDPWIVEGASGHERQRETLGTLAVRTPEPSLDVMVNHWLLHQSLAARIRGRTGFYQSSGAYGFRDQLQDVLALLLCDPGRARTHILECARHQFTEGDVLHWWHPPDGRGVRTRCSDDLLWLPFVVANYVEATGDASILAEELPFLVAPPLAPEEHDRYGRYERSEQAAPLFEHCARALEHGFTRGEHGLPLMRDGDWNDGMNRVGRRGRGESVWLAWFAIATAHAFARMSSLRGDEELARAWHRRADELAAATEEAGWDGAWYRRAYDDEGHPWGSTQSGECCIDSIAQSWAVLSGAGDPGRMRVALESAWRELVREEDGVARLLWPPFDHTPRDPGYIKAYPPGVRENGGQYSHAACWLALAFAGLGDGERALRVLRLVNPIEHARGADDVRRYRVEPYAVCADIFSTPPYVGRGGWTWYTGSAAWMYRAAVEGLLGLRLSRGRLEIDPCLPPSWPRYEATLRRPGAGVLEIVVENEDGTGRGVAEVTIDGRRIARNLVEIPEAGTMRRVVVRLGRADVVRSA